MEIVVFWFACAIGVGVLASSRGRSGIGWFALSCIISPVFGALIVLAIANKSEAAALQRRAYERMAADPRPRYEPRPAPQSVADSLTKLAQLREQGVLTEDEFQQAKQRALSESASAAANNPGAGLVTGMRIYNATHGKGRVVGIRENTVTVQFEGGGTHEFPRDTVRPL